MASCSLCNSFGRTKIQYNYDFAREHAEMHLLQLNIIDDGIDMNQVFEKCFPNISRPRANAEAASENSGRETLIKLCHSMFDRKAGNSSSSVTCMKCGTSVVIFEGGKLSVRAVIGHACSHLGQNLYACRLCDREYSTKNSITRHLTHKHKVTSVGNYDNRLQDYADEISCEIKCCFSACKTEKGGGDAVLIRPIKSSTKWSKLTNQRRAFCQELVIRFVDREGHILCRLCATRIKIDRGNIRDLRSIMDHAQAHLRKPTIRCKICSELFASRSSLRRHLKSKHFLPMANNFVYVADQYHSEIMSILGQCYGEETCPNQPKGVTNSVRSENDVLRNVKGSKLAADRQLLCHRLVRNSIDNERKVVCRLCNKRIGARNRRGFICCHSAMQHAVVHLKKAMMRCKNCSKMFSNRDAATSHLKRKHALPLANNAVRLEDDNHAEIVSMLRQCYGNDNAE